MDTLGLLHTGIGCGEVGELTLLHCPGLDLILACIHTKMHGSPHIHSHEEDADLPARFEKVGGETIIHFCPPGYFEVAFQIIGHLKLGARTREKIGCDCLEES